MRQFVKIFIVLITIAVIVGTTYFLVNYNEEYVENHPASSEENKIEANKSKEKAEVTLESKESIEKYALEEKESIINTIKSTINMNIIANARKTVNRKINKSHYVELKVDNQNESGEIVSGEVSGEEDIPIPDMIPCTIQVAGSMINIVPDDNRLDSFEYHYRGDNKLVAYVRKFAGTNIKATYYFDNGEFLDREVNSFDTKFNIAEDTADILRRANENYEAFLKGE